MTKTTPSVPNGANVLSTLLHDTYERVSRDMGLYPFDVLVAFGTVTGIMLVEVAAALGTDPAALLETYKQSLRLPPATEEGK